MSIKPFILRKPRSFSQTINDTFTYIERHLKPLTLAILYIPLPVLLAGQIMVLIGSFGDDSNVIAMMVDPVAMLDQGAGDAQANTSLVLGGVLIGLVGSLMLVGTIFGYIRLTDLFPGTEIPPARVWRQVKRFFWTDLGAFFAMMMIFGFGAIIVLIPGVGPLVYLGFGLYFFIGASMMGTVYRMENVGVFKAISRSRALIKGYWWRILGVIIIVSLLQSFLTGMFSMSSQVLAYFVSINSLDGETAVIVTRIIVSILQILAQGANAFLYPIVLVCIALNYFSLTELKDDVGLIRDLDQQLDALSIGENL